MSEIHSSRRADRGLECIQKAKYRCWVYCNGNEVLKLCYNSDSVWLMFDRWRYILPTLPLSFSEKENLGKPKEEIGNLNGFEYM
jgi:hypothetical protein